MYSNGLSIIVYIITVAVVVFLLAANVGVARVVVRRVDALFCSRD